jgi:hypothetical protein
MSQPTTPDATPTAPSPDATPTGPDLSPEAENRLLRQELATARGRIEALEAQVHGPRVSPSDVHWSLAISALVELHRVTTTGPGGRGGGNTRYLDAARRLGDALADAILDPSERPAQV